MSNFNKNNLNDSSNLNQLLNNQVNEENSRLALEESNENYRRLQEKVRQSKSSEQQRQLLHQLQVRSSLIRVFLLHLRITMQLSVKTNLLY